MSNLVELRKTFQVIGQVYNKKNTEHDSRQLLNKLHFINQIILIVFLNELLNKIIKCYVSLFFSSDVCMNFFPEQYYRIYCHCVCMWGD